MSEPLPPGIWYEADRRRYRVRVYKGTHVYHLSYHTEREDAYSAWLQALSRKATVREVPVLQSVEQQLAFLTDGVQSGGEDPLQSLITIDDFLTTYFAVPPSKHSAWRWVRNGHLPAVRIGRFYYIKPEDALAFVQRGTVH